MDNHVDSHKTKQIRILAADDDPSVLMIYQDVLSYDVPNDTLSSEINDLAAKLYNHEISDTPPAVYDLVVCSQAQEAVEQVEKSLQENQPFAVAFIDVRMPPGEDGVWAAEKIRQMDSNIEIVLVTGFSDYSPDVISKKIQPPHKLLYIQKPFHRQEIYQFASALTAKWMMEKQIRGVHQELESIVNIRTQELAIANQRLSEDIEKRKKVESALRKSENKYRLLIENAQDSIFIVQNGLVKFANPSSLKVLKYSMKELMQIPIINLIHPEDQKMVRTLFEKNISDQEGQKVISFKALNRNGEELWLQMNMVPIAWEKSTAMLCFVRDLTQAKKLEIQLLHAQKMDAMGALAGGIAHDFNNILSAIMGYTEMSLNELPQDGKIFKRLSRVLQASNRAKDIVKQILLFSRQQKYEKKPVSVKLIVKETLKLLRVSIPSHIEFKENIQGDTFIIQADPTQIHQILLNLCMNAAHAMQANGGLLTIGLTNKNIDSKEAQSVNLLPKTYVKLSVSDTGCGIDDQIIEKVFNPYFTTKKAGEGTGLGLSVVHGIVNSLSGGIRVSSTKGKGTTFDVYLPKYEAKVSEAEIKKDILPRGMEHILLVDDEEIVMEITAEMLIHLGYKVTSRVSSIEALKAFESNPERFDLIITDHDMPDMSGEGLAQRALEIRPDIPIILCTGFSVDIDRERANDIGIRGFVYKPILQKELAQIIRDVLS